jgi:predicted phage terminase large subunit-like protein
VELERYGDMKIANTSTGWKFASSIEGVGTGERGDRVLLDDPHKVDMTESKVVRANTVRWFRTAMMNRLNDQARSAIVVIMQRIAEDDVSGAAIEHEMGFTHLMIPMEYDPERHCETSIGWSDPRSREGELAWPDRFDERVVSELKRDLGPVAYSAQYDQSPKLREGGIFRAEWWRTWNPRDGRFPDCDLIVASLDGAFTEREENDPSALTVWGVWSGEERDERDDAGEAVPARRNIVLMHAFRKHLALSGERSRVERARGESLRDWRVRTQPYWGLLEWVLDVCAYRFRVHHLLIEARGPGISAAQELRNRWAHELGSCGIVLIHPKGDKIARAQSVQPLFAQGCVYAPNRAWSNMVIDEMEVFPRGRHDDLTDSATQALRWLRDNGLAMTEREAQNERNAVRSRRPLEALYPC